MKSIISGLIVFMSASAFAENQTVGYCEEKAVEYVTLLNNKVLEDIGAIQGYEESIDVKVDQTSGGQDSFYKIYSEIFTVSVSGNNDEGDWWVSEYVITMLAALDADTGKLSSCDIQALDYKGVVDSGNPYEDEE